MRHRADADLHEEAGVAEDALLEQDLLGHFLGGTGHERSLQGRTCAVVLLRRQRREGRVQKGAHPGLEVRVAQLDGLLLTVGDIAVSVDADLHCAFRVTGFKRGRAVKLHQRSEAADVSGDDAKRQRQPKLPGAYGR